MKRIETLFSLLSLSLVLTLTACTQPRDNQIADEELDAELISIAELQGEGFEMGLAGNSTTATIAAQSLQIAAARLPVKLNPLLKGQVIQGKPGAVFAVQFQIEPKILFVQRQIKADEQLSALEKDLVQLQNGKKVLPIFAIPVKAAGVLVPIKNELGERTHKFELRETDLANATHVRIDLKSENVIKIQLPKDQPELAREIIDAATLRSKVVSYQDLTRLIPSDLSLNEGSYATKLSQDEELSGTQVKLLIYSIHKKSAIHDSKLLALLSSQVQRLDVQMCDDDIAAQTQPQIEAKDCVLILERSLIAFQVKAELVADSQGRLTDVVHLKPANQKNQGHLLQIAEGSLVRIENSVDRLKLSSDNMISMDLLRDKEFMFRRTFEDAASTLMSFGPGASGNLDLVKFQFETHRLVVKRVTSINGDKNPGEIDQEELFSVPAEYFQTRTAQGLALQPARKTTPDKADAVSLDWLKNTIPVSNSPLSFLSAGQCFLSVGHQAIQGLDQRLEQGILNFSIQGSYTFRPECMSVFGLHDYWYEANAQATYTLSERVSFKVHDPKNDNLQRMDLPFRAQQLLGFGTFTSGIKEQDGFGNSNRLTEEKSRPVIQNFLQGRKVTYVLGGAVAGTAQGDLVIKAAHQVIKDWNEALAKAFQGSSLQRQDNYLELLIEGQDIAKGHLGDLDRNYIYNFEKNMDSGLLGLSQAAPNPRNGLVESANVLMYGGNLMAYIGYEKEIQKIQNEYEALKKSVLAQGLSSQPAASNRDSQKDGIGLDGVISSSANSGKLRPQTPLSVIGDLTAAAPLIKRRLILHTNQVRQTMIDNSALKAQVFEKILSRRDYIQHLVQKAIRLGEMQNSEFMEALTAAEILKAYGNELGTAERRLLSLESQRLALRSEFTKNFRHGPNCFMSTPSAFAAINMITTSPEDVFVNWYSDTLSHELGHSLGLTHNFKGSFDKANFEFAGEKTGREYSSVMDYKPANHIDYRKPGPYDVHALRAAYTGLIEVHEAVQNAAQIEKGDKVLNLKTPEGKAIKIVLLNDKFIQLEDLKSLLIPDRVDSQGRKVKSFWDLNAQMLSRFPLKAHGFCSDYDVGGDPVCARWDAGTTPQEVVQFHIDEYNSSYPVMNSRNARINGVSFGSYVFNVMNSQMKIRSFLDETLFQVLQGQSQKVWLPYAAAAWVGMNHLIETIATPTVNLGVFNADRFSVSEINLRDAQGNISKQTLLIERKALQDLRVPGLENAVETRGVEIDKLLATQFLTLQSLGNPRYDQVSLRFSYADFENKLLGVKEEDSLVIQVLEGLLSGNVSGIKFLGRTPIDLDATMAVDVTDSMRSLGIIGSTLLLDNGANVDSANPARLFLVGSSLRDVPADRPVVTRLGSKLTSPTALKLFAHDPASSIHRLIHRAARGRVVIENTEGLTKSLQSIIGAADETAKAAARAQLLKSLETLNAGGLLASAEDIAGGKTLAAQINVLEKFTASRLSLVAQADEFIKQGAPLEALSDQLEEAKKKDEVASKEIPLLMIAQTLIQKSLSTDQQKQIGELLLNPDAVEGEHNSIVASLEQMNRIISMASPELNR